MYIKDYINVNKFKSRSVTPEGYLSAMATLTKVGVQQYDLSSITGDSKDAGTVVGVYRPPNVVFSDATMDSIKLKPITLHHPNESVTADNYKMYSVGIVGESVSKIDDEHLAAKVQITDKSVINAIQNGNIKQISLGYNAEFEKTNGEYKGDKYQYAFKGSMMANHCAIVDNGRCGSGVSILDNKEGVLMNKDNEDIKNTVDEEPEKPNREDEIVDKPEPEETSKEASTVTDSDYSKMISDVVDKAVSKKLSIIKLASNFIKDSEMQSLNDRAILESALKSVMGKDVSVKDKSDDFIIGALNYASRSIADSKTQRDSISSSITTGSYAPKMYSATEIQQLAGGK